MRWGNERRARRAIVAVPRRRPAAPVATHTRADDLHAVAAETRGEDRLEIRFRARARQVQIRFTQGVDERADDVRAADGDAAGGADVGAEPIEEHDLTVEEHHR